MMPNPEVLNASEPELRLRITLLSFLRLARAQGHVNGIAESIEVARALTLIDILDKDAVRTCLRALLCSNQRQWDGFPDLFDQFWFANNLRSEITPSQKSPVGQRQDGKQGGQATSTRPSLELDLAGEGNSSVTDHSGAADGASAFEVDASADFAFIQDAEQMRAAEQVAEKIARSMTRRLVRRLRSSKQPCKLDLRRTLRAAMPRGGEPLNLFYSARQRRHWQLVVLLDVSKSMSLYSTLFLRFARGLLNLFDRANVFAFHTRLVSLTAALQSSNLEELRDRLKLLSAGWAGGTKIGESLSYCCEQHAPLFTKRTIVLVLSDGLDTGDLSLLASNLQRIRARSHRLVWLNPLLGRAGYQPRAGGMQAALPHIDRFLPANSLRSLEALEGEFARL